MTTDSPLREREPQRQWRIGDHVAWTESEGRVVILALGASDATPMALEGSAGVVWSLLVEHGPVSAHDLAVMIAEEFEVDTQQVLPDVASLLTELRSRDVVSCD